MAVKINDTISDYLISFDGTKIHYQISGKRTSTKNIIFLHGLGGNLSAWDPQRDYFEKQGYRVIAIDIRGHGMSDRPKEREKYTLDFLAKDIATFIEQKKIKNFILVGHCLGGILSLLLTGYFKLKPEKLILIATTYEFPFYARLLEKTGILDLSSDALNQIPFRLGRKGQMQVDKFRGTHDLDPRRILNDIMYTSAQSYVSLYSNLLLFNGEKFLENIKCPTLIIHGEKDLFFPVKIAEQLHKKIKNSKLVLLPNANHIIVLNNPDQLNQIIDTYLHEKVNSNINNFV